MATPWGVLWCQKMGEDDAAGCENMGGGSVVGGIRNMNNIDNDTSDDNGCGCINIRSVIMRYTNNIQCIHNNNIHNNDNDNDDDIIAARARSKIIDREIERDRHRLRRLVKLLLLGAGESGKSTFLKQMRIIHRVQWEPDALLEYRLCIYRNIVRGSQVLCDARDKLAIPWERPRNMELARIAANYNAGLQLEPRVFGHYATTLHSLWQDRAIKTAYERRREYQLSDSVSYFLDELERIARPDYVPTNLDILHCRKATKGISEFTIDINNVPFVFVDVGGQRTQRQKWTQCFDSVTSIIFLVSSSEFDQVLSEDRVTNRLEEAKNIFDTIVNNISFRGISIILFLNKTDLLEKKISNPETDIRWYYPEYKGDPHSLPQVQQFLLEMFANLRREPKTTLYHHFTTAIDTRNIEVVFNSVKDTILNRNLESLMLN